MEPLGPARRAAYDRYARLEADTQVVERRRGSRELDRRVDSVQVLGRQIVRIVPVDDQGYAVAALDENPLDLAPHFAVSYQCNFHNRRFCPCKFTLIFKRFAPCRSDNMPPVRENRLTASFRGKRLPGMGGSAGSVVAWISRLRRCADHADPLRVPEPELFFLFGFRGRCLAAIGTEAQEQVWTWGD